MKNKMPRVALARLVINKAQYGWKLVSILPNLIVIIISLTLALMLINSSSTSLDTKTIHDLNVRVERGNSRQQNPAKLFE